MHPNTFYEQLASLGAEYAQLDDENQRLKLLLQEGCCDADLQLWSDEAGSQIAEPRNLAAQVVESISPPHRCFQEEAMHGMLLGVVPQVPERRSNTSSQASSRSSSPSSPGRLQNGTTPAPPGTAPSLSSEDFYEEMVLPFEGRNSGGTAFAKKDSRKSNCTVGFCSEPTTCPPNDGSADADNGRWEDSSGLASPNGCRRGGKSQPEKPPERRRSITSVISGFSSASASSANTGLESDFSLQGSMESVNTFVHKPMFANLEQMKANIRSQLEIESYNVLDYYKESGCTQAIARNGTFDTITLTIIGLNAIWVAIDTDYNKADLLTDAHPVFQVMEHFFCTYFTAEVFVRFCAFRYKRHALIDMWFLFDSSLVLLMILDTWVINLFLWLSMSSTSTGGDSRAELGNASVLRVARLLRLTRMARMARLLRAMPELLVLLKGMAAAARSVFFTLVLLLILLYMFAIAFTILLAKDAVGQTYFSGVARSMHTLWLYAALLEDITELMHHLEPAGIGYMLLLDGFILLASLTVMNMLVGVLVEVVSAVATAEKTESAFNLVKNKLERIFRELKLDKHKEQQDKGMVSKEEFQRIIENREAARAIQDLGVDVIQMVDMADTLFADEADSSDFKKLSMAEFVEALQQMRGTNFSTVKDLVSLRKTVTKEFDKLRGQMTGIERLSRASFSAMPGGVPNRRLSSSKTCGSLADTLKKVQELQESKEDSGKDPRSSRARGSVDGCISPDGPNSSRRASGMDMRRPSAMDQPSLHRSPSLNLP